MFWMANAAAVTNNSSFELNQSAYFFTANSKSSSSSFGRRMDVVTKSVAGDRSGRTTLGVDHDPIFEEDVALDAF